MKSLRPSMSTATAWARFAGTAVIVATLSVSNLAVAGGFDRFGQDVSLLFDPASTVVEGRLTYIEPWSEYDTVNGAGEKVPLVTSFFLGFAALKVSPTENSACLMLGSEPFGTDVDHGNAWSKAEIIVEQRLRIYELSATCSYRFKLGHSMLRALGGVSRDWASYRQTALDRTNPTGPVETELDFSATSWSWRGGLAYEDPKSGTVLSVVYFAPIEFDFDGELKNLPLGGGTFLKSAPIQADGTIPEGVEVSLRGLIAPEWGSGVFAKWVRWSELEHVPVIASENAGPIAKGTEILDLQTEFRDGLTIGGYLAHALNERAIVGMRVIWDRGVTTGWTEHTESWTLVADTRYNLTKELSLSASLGIILQDGGTLDQKRNGAPFDANFDDAVALVPQISVAWRQ